MLCSRFCESVKSVTVDTTLAECDPVSYGDFSSGVVNVPTGSSVTSLAFHVSTESGGTYTELNDDSGAVSMTVGAGKSYALPAELTGARWFKMVPNADGVVSLTLKS